MFNATPLVRDTPPHSSRTTARKARSVHPRLSIQFRSILATIRNWLPDLCPTYRTRIAKNPSLSNRNIRSVDFSSGPGAEDARTEVCARSMPPILLYSMNRKLGPRICIYIYIFPFFLFSSPFFIPSPLPSREFETRPRETRQRASLFDPREIRWDMEYEGGEEMVGFTADSKDRRVEGDRWWWSMVFFIFIFFPSPGYINKIETNLKLKYIYIFFIYTCVIKFDVTTFLNFIKMYG